MTVGVPIPWYRHYYPVTSEKETKHHEEAHDSRLYGALAFRRADDYSSGKPDSDVPALPLGSVVSKVNANERSTG